MTLYYVPMLLVVEAESPTHAVEVSDDIVDGVLGFEPAKLQGAVFSRSELVLEASANWIDVNVDCVITATEKP